MIILGSAWTSNVIDLQVDDDTEYPLTGYTLQVDIYEGRPGTGSPTGDDYGSATSGDQPAPLLTATTTDGGVVISSASEGKFYFTLSADVTAELRQKLGPPYWKGRRLMLQVRRTDSGHSDHIIFLIERTLPGAGP